jgi:hypothetical protein
MDLTILDIVYKLGRSNSVVPFSSVPPQLYNDFVHFMTGRAFTKRNGEFVAYPSDFKDWLRKLSTIGISHE